MSEIKSKRIGPGWITLLVLAGLVDLALLMRRFLEGKNVTLFNPQGLISHDQHDLFIFVITILCLVAIPVVLFLYFVAWKFRESNTKVVHTPDARQRGKLFVFSIWAYPILVFFIMTSILIPATFKLEPKKALNVDAKPLTIEVIALRWKWVFLYPEQHVATVNYVQLPVDRPVTFELTADDAPMSAFWIPNIGGQLYAMTGHVNRLNLLADKVGNFRGSSPEINGAGFAGMTFAANVSTPEDFSQWVSSTRQNSSTLDMASYDTLLQPSEDTPAGFYGNYDGNLYATVLMKYMSHDMYTHEGGE